MTERLHALVIDDHTLFREGLERLLVSRNIEVVASVSSGEEGIRQVERTNPDIILLDLRMPDMDGMTVLKCLMERKTAAPIVVLTTSNDEKDAVPAIKAGARGYLMKDIDPDNLVILLRKAVAGEVVFSPAMRELYAHALRHHCHDYTIHPISTLTPRERETLEQLAEGQSNKTIAIRLGISEGTVKLHVKAILRKLQVHSRVKAAVMMVKYGYSGRNSR